MSDSPPPPMPDLRIVPIEDVLAHEEHDLQRSLPLIERIELMGTWLNPPIVSPIPTFDGSLKYAILDGANRCYSLRVMNFPHILVQVVSYAPPQVRLETWNHVLSAVEVADFLPKIQALQGLHLEQSDFQTAQAALDMGEALCYIHVLPDTYWLAFCPKLTAPDRSLRLRQVVDAYKHVAQLDRINQDEPNLIRALYPKACAVVVFPTYTPDEILQAAYQGLHLPPGISRHIIQGRAMRLHYPLEALRDYQTSLAEKNAALQSWIQTQAAHKHIRLYEEATYVFDD